MRTLTVSLGERSYPIRIGSNAWSSLLNDIPSNAKIIIVTNDVVGPLYLSQIEKLLADHPHETLVLQDGEQHKNLTVLNQIFDGLIEYQADRKSIIFALGGGVVGDIAGFAAACYQRGIQFIQLPTTLLAMVDSSVGGKTGVNHALGKNMIGAFHQPQQVLINPNTLLSLPNREFKAGLAEVIKYGLILDAEFIDWLETNMALLLNKDIDCISEAIYRSCEYKAALVARDEKETGQRALLNLGHTFGHAIEASQGYGQWLHGEAVAAGTVMAADLSKRLGWIEQHDVSRITTLLMAAGLPTQAPKTMTPDDFLKYMAVDKKNQGGKIRLILLRAIGEAVLTDNYSENALHDTLLFRD